MPTETIVSNFVSFTDAPLHIGDIIIRSQSRFAELKHRRIQGNVIIEPFCSHFELERLHITKGRLRVMGGCFQGRIAGVFIDETQGNDPALWVGDGGGTVCTTLTLERIQTRWAQGWGIHLTNQVTLTAIGLAADECGKAGGETGGMLLVSAHGNYSGLNCESNNIGIRFYGCQAVVNGHNLKDNKKPLIIDGPDSKVEVRP